jgi:hypothetical protein
MKFAVTVGHDVALTEGYQFRRKTSAAEVSNDSDARLIELAAQWTAASARYRELDRRRDEVESSTWLEPPKALIKTEQDHRHFTTDERVGDAYESPKTFARMETVMNLAVTDFVGDWPVANMIARLKEIRAAREEYESAVKAAVEASGYRELERLTEEAFAEAERLGREVCFTTPSTVQGLLAKLSAVAHSWGRDTLEDYTRFKECERLTHDDAARIVLLDCIRTGPVVTA